jgi:hypothetical protein
MLASDNSHDGGLQANENMKKHARARGAHAGTLVVISTILMRRWMFASAPGRTAA